MRRLVAVVAAILLFGWASRAGTRTPRFIGHEQPAARWLLGSGVCGLGKLAFVAWSVALLACLTLRLRAPRVLGPLLVLTVLLTAAMNPPLAVRALPAYLLIAVLIS